MSSDNIIIELYLIIIKHELVKWLCIELALAWSWFQTSKVTEKQHIMEFEWQLHSF